MNPRFVTLTAIVITASSVILTGCSRRTEPPGSADIATSAIDAAQAADTIYVGGDIVTVNDAQPTAESIALKDGRIVAVGSRIDVEKARKGTATRIVDLAGRTLVPGFIDGHSHFLGFGSQAVGARY